MRWLLLVSAIVVAAACRDAPTPAEGEADASARAPIPSADPRRGDALFRDSERCLADPRCPADEAAKLYAAADDVGATKVSCFRFYYDADLERARRCFERSVRRERRCEGSPSLERIFLGVMLMDAQGGAREVDRAKELFTACSEGNDSGVALAVERRQARKPLDFCKDVVASTLDIERCAEVDWDRRMVTGRREMKAIVAELALDEAALASWQRADGAWTRFSSDDARYVGDAFRGGSVRVAQETSVRSDHEAERAAVLRALLDRKTRTAPSAGALEEAESRALAAARDAEQKKLFNDARASWEAYRDAERAFVSAAFAKRYASARAAVRALDAELAIRRAEGLHRSSNTDR